MSLAAIQIRSWIVGLALLTLGASLNATAGGPASMTTGAAAALLVIGALLASRTLAVRPQGGDNRQPLGAPQYARTRDTSVSRQCDPDAPGRARPRAPGNSPCN